MEDKKSLFLFVGVAAAVSIAAMGILFIFMKPASVREAEVVGVSPTHFPDGGARASAPPGATAASVSGAPAPVPTGPSSLSFIQKGEGVTGAGGAGTPFGPSRDAETAAARGDAAGVMSELRKGNAADDAAASRQDAARVRATMQAVVDTVHELQPNWYEDFLANESLKRIADNYDKTKDFPSFVRALAASRPFTRMLGAKATTSGMRSLVKALFADAQLARDIRRVAAENSEDANLSGLMAKYGRKCGFPQDLVGSAESIEKESAPARKAAPAPRPQLKLKAFDNGRGSGQGQFNRAPLGAGGKQQQQQPMPGLPPGVDVEQLKKQYGQ